MRIVFFGNNQTALAVLRWLKSRGETLVGLVVHPPERQKCGLELVAECGLDAAQTLYGDQLQEPAVLAKIRDAQPDVALSVYFGYILKPELLGLFPSGVLNLHPAFLPYNRGAYPNVWSIVEGTPVGATLHYMDAGVDTGDILAQQQLQVDPTDTGQTLYHRLERLCLDLFKEAWPAFKMGRLPRQPQEPCSGTSHRIRDVEAIDAIDLNRAYTARELINLLRARTFHPIAGLTLWRGGEKFTWNSNSHMASLQPKTVMDNFIKIGSRRIGPGEPSYLVAEMSANHGQKFDQAVALIRAAKAPGADAIKLQTYTPDTLTIACENQYFRIKGGTQWDGRTLHELYCEAYTPWDWQPKLKTVAEEVGLDCFSTPFDATAVDFLESLGVPAHKVASFELVDLPLLRRMAGTGKPLIMSTGMASLAEIEEAVRTIREAGGQQLALLKCTSAYPAVAEDMNLRTIPDLASRSGLAVGLSDHTLGIAVPVAAVALGACIIEKHLALSRSVAGPDSNFSLEPVEFKAMVEAVRTAERALGRVSYEATVHEQSSRVFRRSLFVVQDIRRGEVFTAKNVRSIRPGYGLHTRFLDEVLGCVAPRDIPRGTPLDWNLVKRPEGPAYFQR